VECRDTLTRDARKVVSQRPIVSQRQESGWSKRMHQHKILTYMYFVCFIEDEQVPKQVGGGSGTHRAAKWWVNTKVTLRRRRWLENVSCHMLLLFWVKKFESHIGILKRMVWQIPWRKTQSLAKYICTYSGQLHKMNCVNTSNYIYRVHCRIEEDQVPKQVGGRPRRNTKTWKRSEEWTKYAKIIRTRVSVRALMQ
jgi:hypothetical protein